MRKVNRAISSSSKMRKLNLAIASSSPSQRKRRRQNEMVVNAPSSLPQDVIEEIFLRLPLKALIQLKCLSKEWRSTIESRSFAERHLKISKISQEDHPKVMVISEENALEGIKNNMLRPDTDMSFSTICLESGALLSSTLINFPQGFLAWILASESCDGLFCMLSPKTQVIYVVNPAIRWLRPVPPARLLISLRTLNHTQENFLNSVCHIAFVKASDYKLVWLYNSEHYNADASSPNEGVTKCEVFDFKANAWRYLACTPSYRIFHHQPPVSTNRSIYWLTEAYGGEIKVVTLDIHTEKFQVLPKIIPAIARTDPNYIDMCTLDNHLCMSKRDNVTKIQDLWRLKSSQDSWEKIYTIDLLSCSSCPSRFPYRFNWTRDDTFEPSTPVAICKNKKIMLSHRYKRNLIKYDPQTKSLSFVFQRPMCRKYAPYFYSLISHI